MIVRMSPHPQAPMLWQQFCVRFAIAEQAVPLFETDSAGRAVLKTIGRGETRRQVLARSAAMEHMVRTEVSRLVADWEAGARRLDGLIYMMGHRRSAAFEPLYIGKTETLGKGNGNLSANIQNLQRDSSKFARWGDNYAYHIGDLSACVLPEHPTAKQTIKYQSWANALFEEAPSAQPVLREPVYFWAKAWNREETGIWSELGPTRLAFLEYLLIGVAGLAFPGLLNREGLAR